MSKTVNTHIKAKSVGELTTGDFLKPLFGEIFSIDKKPLQGSTSFSGSRHEKVTLSLKDGSTVSLVMKIISPSKDLIVWRSGNFPNREASLVGSEELRGIWDIVQSPYVAYCSEEEESALLMHDLSSFLFPDVREPVSKQDEQLVLQTLARLHARFWQIKPESSTWLTKQELFFNFLGPKAPEEERQLGRSHPILNAVEAGWKLVEQNLPVHLSEFIFNPPFEKFTTGLPMTLIHGDSKLGNLAIVPDRKLSAFDWTSVAIASPAVEIGWYIAVNASRLSSAKEDILNRYREYLEKELGKRFNNDIWEQMSLLSTLIGARTLLWNKALNVQKDLIGAKEEWNWWVAGINKCYQYC